MAVIKIVPMPGAVGDKGDPGETGAQGPQGQTGQTGQNGQDALWSYQGAWQSNAAYAVGDLVTYEGQLYYAKSITTAGTLPTDTSKFDLIAAKSADGSQLNYWDGASVPQDPAEDGFLIVDGIVTGPGSNILVSADDRVFIGGNNGEFLNGLSTPENQIATIGDLTTPTSGTWTLNFNTNEGTLVESAPSSETFAEYYTIGDLVYFDMQYSFVNITNYGSGYYLFNLPFLPKRQTLVTGLVVDTTSPDSGSNVIYGSIQTVHPVTLNSGGWVSLKYQDTSNQMELLDMSFSDPASLSGLQISPYNRITISGVYRKA